MATDPTLEPVVFGAAVDGMRKALGKRLHEKFRPRASDVEHDRRDVTFRITWA